MAFRPADSPGFTLIELMVVVVIATILISVAIPSYTSYIRQSRRMDAKTAVLDIAAREERYFSTTGSSYTSANASLGYGGAAWPVVVGNGYYQVSVCMVPPGTAGGGCPPSALAGPAYTITATPVAGTSQAGDTLCTSFSVDSSGVQYATGTQTAQWCWAN